MYLTHISALMVTAFQSALGAVTHPVLGGKDVWVGSEFPNDEANYPGVWVSYDAGATLRGAGVGHTERVPIVDIVNGKETVVGYRDGTRWTFDGTVDATVVALARYERDELLDEVTRMIAFGNEQPETSLLRQTLEANPYIAVRPRLGEFRLTVQSMPGQTPWGSNEAVWEGSVAFDVEGEFVSDLTSARVLLPITAIDVEERVDLELRRPEDLDWH